MSYVDNLLMISNYIERLKVARKQVKRRFSPSDRGEQKNYIVIKITTCRGTLKTFQPKHTEKRIQNYGQDDCALSSLPCNVNEDLCRNDGKNEERDLLQPYIKRCESSLYIGIHTQPDVAYMVNNLAHHVESRNEAHLCSTMKLLGLFERHENDWHSNRPWLI